ncbi:MAG: nucleotidyltransferase domain-containing protein [Gammaproteobacteria bacterium]|nr:nucleotidyltransferase domain-containing protein [Gammaproteobacteria bacterium]
MKFGLTKEQYAFIDNTVLVPLKEVNAKVWVFGSRTRGDHQTFSDLDLVIESDIDVTTTVGKIEENLIESNFPYKVDLILEKNLADAYRPGFLQDRVLF